jgi:hypothetical protein
MIAAAKRRMDTNPSSGGTMIRRELIDEVAACEGTSPISAPAGSFAQVAVALFRLGLFAFSISIVGTRAALSPEAPRRFPRAHS